MSKGAEQALKDRAHKWLRGEQARGRLWYFKVHGSRFQRKGVPDFIICVGGVLFAPELKDERERAEPAQKRQIELIRKAGGIAGVIRSLESLKIAVGRIEIGNLDGARLCFSDERAEASKESYTESGKLQFLNKKRL